MSDSRDEDFVGDFLCDLSAAVDFARPEPPDTRDAMTMIKDAIKAIRDSQRPFTAQEPRKYGKGYDAFGDNFGLSYPVPKLARMGGLV